MTINVNGMDVYTATADQTPPGNGQHFTITQSFDPANTVVIKITSTQNPNFGTDTTLYTMEYDSLTLSN
jgi:hypothetical protein